MICSGCGEWVAHPHPLQLAHGNILAAYVQIAGIAVIGYLIWTFVWWLSRLLY